MKTPSAAGFAGMSVAALASLLLLFQPAFLSVYDESIVLTGALHVLRGEAPGVDFYTVYGPLQFYVVAPLLALFDGNVFVIRLLYALTLAVPISLLAQLLSPLRSRFELWLSLAYSMLAVLACSLYASPGYPNHSLPLVCVGILYLKRSNLESSRPRLFVVTLSLLLTAAVLLRPTIGLVLMLAMASALPFEAANAGDIRPGRLVGSSGRLAAAVALTLVWVAIGNLLGGGALVGVVEIILTIQSQIYPEMRGLPFPNPFDGSPAIGWNGVVAAYAPPVLVGAGATLYLLALSGRVDLEVSDRTTLLWLLVLSCLLYSLALLRTDGPHLLPTILFSSLTGAFVLKLCANASRQRGASRRRVTAMLAAALALGVANVLAFAVDETAVRPTLATSCDWDEIAGSREACLLVSVPGRRTLDYLARHLDTNERIFSANSRHDRIFVNNLSYYALSGHLPITFWAHMDPGVQTTAVVQAEIVDELETHARSHGRSIVVVEQVPLRDEPNRSVESSGVHLLDTYLAGCRQVFEFETTAVRECTASPSIAADRRASADGERLGRLLATIAGVPAPGRLDR